MMFMVGIERPKSDTEAWGLIVPVFETLGYGCIAASDTERKVLYHAKQAILTMAEEVLTDGHLLTSLNGDFQSYRDEFPEYDDWIALEVDVERLKRVQKRINITLSEPLLARVDAYVGFHKEFKDRSDFLAKAADQFMSEQKK